MKKWNSSILQFSSIAQSCLTLCNPIDCSTPGFPVHHQLPDLAQIHAHWVGDAIQASHPLSSPPPPAFNLSQHQSLFQWVLSSHQVVKVLELQPFLEPRLLQLLTSSRLLLKDFSLWDQSCQWYRTSSQTLWCETSLLVLLTLLKGKLMNSWWTELNTYRGIFIRRFYNKIYKSLLRRVICWGAEIAL